MGEAGIIGPEEHVELLNGELLLTPPMKPDHAATVSVLLELFLDRLVDRAKVRSQLPVTLDSISEPEPDVVIARWRSGGYRDAHPVPGDVLLIVEVSDATLTRDRTEKLAAYARAEIPEYWIVNLKRRVVERFREPVGPRYRSHEIALSGTTISPSSFPDAAIPVDAIFGIETGSS